MEGQIGTTLAAAVIKDDEFYWASVGDSRIYLYRRGRLIQLTTDHDYARELAREVELGRISPEDAANHPQCRALTSYLGSPFLQEIDRNEDPVILEEGDRILLCSDGLYKTLPEEEILKLLDDEPQHAADNLIEATLARGKTTQDNVTVVILACEVELEIGFFKYWIGTINLYAKGLIVILVLFSLVSAAYFITQYFISPKTHAKDKVGKDRNGDKVTGEVSPGQGGIGTADQVQHWTPSMKQEAVLRLLRGEPMELLSRELGLELSSLKEWRDVALAGMSEALKAHDGDSLQAELDQARKRLEELTKENELLKARGKKTKGRRSVIKNPPKEKAKPG